MAKKKRGLSKKQVGIGVVVTAAAAAGAAGAYFLYGSKDAAKNRKRVKGWMLKAKGEVLEKMEQAKELSRDDYERLVDSVLNRYRKMSMTSTAEVNDFAQQMKRHWKGIQRASGRSRKRAKKAGAKRSVRKKLAERGGRKKAR